MKEHRFPLFAWVLLLIFIPMLSINGRLLQRLFREHFDALFLAVLIALLLGLFMAAVAVWFRKMGRSLISLLWAIPLFCFAPFLFSIVEERIHFVVFGLFGFFSQLLFKNSYGWAVCFAVAGGDELLQWWLPDRVGDWRDVAINASAGLGGLLLAWSGGRADVR